MCPPSSLVSGDGIVSERGPLFVVEALVLSLDRGRSFINEACRGRSFIDEACRGLLWCSMCVFVSAGGGWGGAGVYILHT